MPPPAKRQRLSTSNAYDNIPGIKEHRRKNELRLKSRFEAIYDKYDRDFTGIGDVIDMNTGQIVIDNGHLRGMRHERDLGVDKIGPKPVVKSTSLSKRIGRKKQEEDVPTIRRRQEDEHDELSSPQPHTATTEVVDIPLVLPVEGAWAKPEELNDPVLPKTAAQVLGTDETAQLMSRIAAQIGPSPEGQIVLDTNSMAFIISEVTRGLQRQQGIVQMTAVSKLSLLTPPRSESAAPIQKLSSVWREEEEGEQCDGEIGEEQGDREIEQQDGEDQFGEEGQPMGSAVQRRRRFTQAEDIEILRMKEQGLSYSEIARQIDRSCRSVNSRYYLLESTGIIGPSLFATSTPQTRPTRRTTINLPIMQHSKSAEKQNVAPQEKSRRRTRQSFASQTVLSASSSAVSQHGGKRRSVRLSLKQVARSVRRSAEQDADARMSSSKRYVTEDSEGVEEPLETKANVRPISPAKVEFQAVGGGTSRTSDRLSLQEADLQDDKVIPSQIASDAVKQVNLQQHVASTKAGPVDTAGKPSTITPNRPGRRSQRFSHVEILVPTLPPQASGEASGETAVAQVKPAEIETSAQSETKGPLKKLKKNSPRHPWGGLRENSLIEETKAPAIKAPSNSLDASPERPATSKPPTNASMVGYQDDLGSEDELGF